ncbi:hypothetical protein [Ligilactobacillus aviarius]|uniref:hypothetical protein n=1 Tax=Ligilactobacillus aviarius TaxID=1606 RepID=UPI0024BA42F8|nr:hypothetical protein [Ligilactobacillus aviarius]
MIKMQKKAIMKGNNEFYLLLFLENDKSRISFRVLTQDRQVKGQVKITKGLQLWSVIKEIKKIASRKRIKTPKVNIVGYDLVNIIEKFKDKAVLKEKGKENFPTKFVKAQITTNSHSTNYYKYNLQIRCCEAKNLMSAKNTLQDMAKSPDEDGIETLQRFVMTWFELLQQLNQKYDLNFTQLPSTCGVVVDKVVNKVLQTKSNNYFKELIKRNLKENKWKKGQVDYFCNKNKGVNWELMRKGYCFDSSIRYDKRVVSKVKILPGVSEPFNLAKEAYYGGHTGDDVYGKIDDSLLVDTDLKAAYNTSGHLIPDFMAGLPWIHAEECNFADFQKRKDILVNGPFTVGFLDCDVSYPNDGNLVLSPCRHNGKTKYFRKSNHVKLTYTDAYNAYYNGAKVYVHQAYFPQQEKLDVNNSKEEYSQQLSPYGLVQDMFAQKRKENKDNALLNGLYKLLGNSIYGKSAQGITNDNVFSKITNPFIAAQYTAITKLLLSFNINALQNHYQQKAKLLTIMTDGFLMKFDKKISRENIENYLNNKIKKDGWSLWKYVGSQFFNGVYFEIKHITITDLMVIRANFQVSADGIIHAMSGIQGDPLEVYHEFVTGKHHSMQKHKDMDANVHFRCSFNRKLVKFHQGKDGIGYFDTEPFNTYEEQLKYTKLAKRFNKVYNIYSNSNGDAFIRTMNEYKENPNKIWVKKYEMGSEDYNKLNFMRFVVGRLEYSNKILTEEEKNNLKFNLYNRYFKRFYKGVYFFKRQYDNTISKMDYNLIDYIAVKKVIAELEAK